ncbi:MAG TPA: hypothetical protein VLA00_11110 [Xanthobacteraceae bacterium]|nr:hypothetical protein [Xanthobacteraceae bacterium]
MNRGLAVLADLRRLACAAAMWLAAAGAAGAAPSRALNAEDVFHIYFVDVGAAATRGPDVMNYIFDRWRGLADGAAGRGQNGVLILIHGPRGLSRTLPLDPDPRRQVRDIRDLFKREIAEHDPQSATGIELNEAGRLIDDEVQRMLARAVDDFRANSAVRGRFVVVHLIAEQLLFRSTEHGLAWVLSRPDRPDLCFLGDAMSRAIADFPRLAQDAVSKSRPVALRGALVLVAAGDARFPPAAERAAALHLLGRAAVARQAVALRDGLRCLETDAAISIDAIDEAPCMPGGPGAAVPVPARTPASCLAIGQRDTETQRQMVQNARLTDLIAPVAQAADVLAAAPVPVQGPPVVPSPPPVQAPLPAPQVRTPQPPPVRPVQNSAPVATAPPPVPLASAPGPGAPPPAKAPIGGAEPGLQLAQVSQAVSVLAGLPQQRSKAIDVTISVTDPRVRLMLVPAGLPPTADETAGAVDITGGTTRRQVSGAEFMLVARLAPSARCPGPAPLDFDVSVSGYAIAEDTAGRFRVRILNACSTRGVAAVFGRVRMK